MKERFINDEDFREKVIAGEYFTLVSYGEVVVLESEVYLYEEHLDSFETLPEHIQDYMLENPFLYVLGFNYNQNFRQRLELAKDLVPGFDVTDLEYLLTMQSNIVPDSILDYERVDGKILINSASIGYKRIYDHIMPYAQEEEMQLVFSLLEQLTEDFYLSQDGRPSRPTDIKHIGEAKSWAGTSYHTEGVFDQVSNKVIEDAGEKVKIIDEILSLLEKYEEKVVELSSVLTNSRDSFDKMSHLDSIKSEMEYIPYLSVARELMIISDMLTQPLPVEFITEPVHTEGNLEVVNRLAEEVREYRTLDD